MYAKSVAAFQQAFTDVLVIVAEDLRDNLREELCRTFKFLGVDPDFEISDLKERNVGKVSRVWLVEALCRRVEKRCGHFPGVGSVLSRVRRINDYRPKLNPNTARTLAEDFKADVAGLEKLIGRDLSFWLDKYR